MIGFLVEDGTGLANATSYISTDTANTILAIYGEDSAWTSLSANTMQGALIQASKCIDRNYGQSFYGLVSVSGAPIQGLLWPRFVLVVNRIQIIQQVIPIQLAEATAEVALMASQKVNLYPQPNQLRYVKSQTKKVGTLETQTDYMRSPKAEKFTGFWKVEQILKPLIREDDSPSFLSP